MAAFCASLAPRNPPETTKAPGSPGPCLVRERGVEPLHPFGYSDLNAARLPIPPLARN